MSVLKYVFLFVGSVALWLAFFNFINGQSDMVKDILTVIFGTIMVLGYFRLKKNNRFLCRG